MQTTTQSRHSWSQHYYGESVRVRIEPDNDYDLEFSDCDESIREDLKRSADRHGVFLMISEYRCPCCDSWAAADCIGGMIYADIWDEKENGYLPDLIKSAQAGLDEVNAKLIR